MKKTTATKTVEFPALDVDGVIFIQDGRNSSSPEDFFLGESYCLRDCGDGFWRFFGDGLDFCMETPLDIVGSLRELGAELTELVGHA